MDLLIDETVQTHKRVEVKVKVTSGGLLAALHYVRPVLLQFADQSGFRPKGSWTLERADHGWLTLSRAVEPRDWPPRA